MSDDVSGGQPGGGHRGPVQRDRHQQRGGQQAQRDLAHVLRHR